MSNKTISIEDLLDKVRPKSLERVVGNEEQIQFLLQSLKSGIVPPAIIFHGTHGTGKTTIARLYSQLACCENVQDFSYCNLCLACLNRDFNILEFNAANESSIDSIREIVEDTKIRPRCCKYKFYIFDEAHVLSPASFSVLLKETEEPLPYVKYIFITNSLRKIPLPLQSRAILFDFKQLHDNDLKKLINYVLPIFRQFMPIQISESYIEYAIKCSDGIGRNLIYQIVRDAIATQGSLFRAIKSNTSSFLAQNVFSEKINITEKIQSLQSTQDDFEDILKDIHEFFIESIKTDQNQIKKLSPQNLSLLHREILRALEIVKTHSKVAFVLIYIIDKIIKLPVQ